MQLQSIQSFTLPNGFVAVLEDMPDVQSAAFSLLIPAGCIYENEGVNGTASALGDLVTRGAGSRDSRKLSTDLDNLGVQRSEQVGWNFISLSGALLAENLLAALEIYADIAQRPHLPEDEFEPVMAGLEQGLLALEDEPQRKLSTELRRRTYHAPWNRPTEGRSRRPSEHLDGGGPRACGPRVPPNGAILGVAGRFDAEELKARIVELFGDWPSVAIPDLVPGIAREADRSCDAPVDAGADRTDVPCSALWRSRLLRGLGGGERAGRRPECAAVHGSPREAGAVLFGAGVAQQPEDRRPDDDLCRHDDRAGAGNARRHPERTVAIERRVRRGRDCSGARRGRRAR